MENQVAISNGLVKFVYSNCCSGVGITDECQWYYVCVCTKYICSYAPISTKFGTQVALRIPKSYISTIFGTICSKIEENMSNSR